MSEDFDNFRHARIASAAGQAVIRRFEQQNSPGWQVYRACRKEYPTAPASLVLAYARDDEGLTFPQYQCAHTGKGHDWTYSDPEEGGNDRMFCARCGADGDG